VWAFVGLNFFVWKCCFPKVTVTEVGVTNPRSSSVTMTVSLLDVNDNAPFVPSQLLTHSTPEGTKTNEILVQVSALLMFALGHKCLKLL
jgi:hypothetical protein